MNLRLLSRGLMLVALLSTLLIQQAAAYVGQNPYSVRLDGPSGVVSCRSEVVITATVRAADTGQLVGGQSVLWDFKASRSAFDRLSSRVTVTGVDGKTSVTLHFGSAEGTRTVRATIATWPATIDVTCRGGVTTPRPTTNPTPRPTTNPTPRPTTNPSANPTATNNPPASASVPPTDLPTSAPSAPPTVPGDTASPQSLPTGTPPGASVTTAAPASPGPTASGLIPAPTSAPGEISASSSGIDLTLLALLVLAIGFVAAVLVWVRVRR